MSLRNKENPPLSAQKKGHVVAEKQIKTSDDCMQKCREWVLSLLIPQLWNIVADFSSQAELFMWSTGGFFSLPKKFSDHRHTESLKTFGAAVAIREGSLAYLKWADRSIRLYFQACDLAAECGRLEILNWLIDQGFPWGESTFESAVRYGQLEVLNWLNKNDCPWSLYSCSRIAGENGHLEVLKWLYENGYLHPDTCTWAAYQRNWEMLKWAHERGGCLLTESTFEWVAVSGHVEMMQWLREKNCPVSSLYI